LITEYKAREKLEKKNSRNFG